MNERAPDYEIENFGNVRLELVFASFVSLCVFSSLGLLQSELLSSRPGWRLNISTVLTWMNSIWSKIGNRFGFEDFLKISRYVPE